MRNDIGRKQLRLFHYRNLSSPVWMRDRGATALINILQPHVQKCVYSFNALLRRPTDGKPVDESFIY